MAISPSTTALKQALKTDTAVKTFKAVNKTVNTITVTTDLQPFVQKSIEYFTN